MERECDLVEDDERVKKLGESDEVGKVQGNVMVKHVAHDCY